MPIVTARAVHRSFGPRRVLDDVSVSIHRGERVGMVGLNGAGKSTLGRILAGVDVPDSGTVAPRRGARIAHLAQRPVLAEGATALSIALSGLQDWSRARRRYESLNTEISAGDLPQHELDGRIAAQAAAAEELERHGGWDLVHRAEAILGHLGIADPDAAAIHLSGGEQRRVDLARVLIAQPDLAVLDEPTNHLDLESIDWLERFLLDEFAGALLLITHDRYLLDRVATRTLELSDGHLYSYDGRYEDYLQAKAERQAHEERAESNRRNMLRTELEWLRRQPKARTTKSQSRIARIEAAAAIAAPRPTATVELSAAAARSGKTVLELHDVSVRGGGRTLVEHLTLYLGQGERIGIVGPNGCGKSTLLRCLTGEEEPSAGKIVRGANTRIAYLEQGSRRLDDDATVFENVIGDRTVVRAGELELSPRMYLERFLFDYSAQTARVGTLSGGERARVRLAKLLAEPSNLLILDEPT
ncbi:MAG TPA: ABC-F family ATP-binding cassette domain-containing protein, partial [Terriglobales bacterium]|nr:ABC-F family ATP-binding cassette domain-containing protein [Terriglobales bacterium]